jgi:hypothetical protein
LPANRHGMFGGMRRTSAGSWVGVKVRNVAGREIASFPNPLCVFWLDWPPPFACRLRLGARWAHRFPHLWHFGRSAARTEERRRTGIHFWESLSHSALAIRRPRTSREER